MLEGNVERLDRTVTVPASDQRESEARVRMCIDNPPGVDDAPKAPGVWRRVGDESNNCWSRYQCDLEVIIFSAFCNGGSSVEWDDWLAKPRKRKRDEDVAGNTILATHRADFDSMKEIELSTGVEVDIWIVQAPISSINYKPTEDPVEVGVWWKDDFGKWHCYGQQALLDIREAWRRSHHFVVLKQILTRRYPSGVVYIVNLTTMEQTNPKSGKVRPIRIIANMSMPPEVPPCRNFPTFTLGMVTGRHNLPTPSLTTALLRDSLQTLLNRKFIDSVVANMVLAPHGILAIEANKHLKEADAHPLYWKFRQAYEAIIRRVPGYCGQLMRLRTQTPDFEEECSPDCATSGDRKPMLRHVLYLAPASEVEKIFDTGLQDGCQPIQQNFALSTDYFELNYKGWELSTYSLLLFLVVVPNGCRGAAGLQNAIPVDSVDHLLPIGKLALRVLQIELPTAHESEELGAMGSYPSDSANQNDVCPEVLCLESARGELREIATLGPDRVVHPSKSELEMLLFFKLYCPKSEKLRFVGGLAVQVGGRPAEILPWLRDRVGFSQDAEIRLYRVDMAKCIDLNSTYRENQLEDGSVLSFNVILTRDEKRNHRCPDWPAYTERVRKRQVLKFRRLSNPTVDEFCLELSKDDTYSDVVERVAQHLELEDENRLKLTFNDVLHQEPQHLPLPSNAFCTLVGNAYRQTASVFYFEILDSRPPELDGSTTLTIAFHGGRAEKLSVHEIELPRLSTVKDAVDQLRGMVRELSNPALAEMRLYEVSGTRVCRIHPPNEKVGFICGPDSGAPKSSLIAVEIPEQDKDMGAHDRLIHVRHFHCLNSFCRKIDFFGEPFLMVVREHETLAQVRERIRSKVEMPDEEFSDCEFALLAAGRREKLHVNDLVASRLQEFAMGFYDPVLHFVGLEHVEGTKFSSTQSAGGKASRGPDRLRGNPKSGQAKSTPSPHEPSHGSSKKRTLKKGDSPQNKGQAEPHTAEPPQLPSPTSKPPDAVAEKAVLAAVEPPPSPETSDKSVSPALMQLAIVSNAVGPLSSHRPLPVLDAVISQITVPDAEFHNFDLKRLEKDVLPGQVWAIYDNHDGMPRFYGLVTQVSRSPFQVRLSWLEPPKGRWWVEATGLSIACGEFEISQISETEKQIGVFSHKVFDKVTAIKGNVEIYPRKDEVWAIFSNWDVMQTIGPRPIFTPQGLFCQCYAYEVVQMLDDYSPKNGVPVVRLVKTPGFRTVFHPQLGLQGTKTVMPRDLRRFSHKIPAGKTPENFPSGRLPPDALELDPGALPSDLSFIDNPATH